MKHKNKRLAAVFLTLCMVLGLLPSMAFAEELPTNPPAIEQLSTVDEDVEENIETTEEEPVAEYAGEVAPLNAVDTYADSASTTIYVNNVDARNNDSLPSGVTYDANSNTLTLKNANLTESYTDGGNSSLSAAIYAKGDLTIKLEGTNTITYNMANGFKGTYVCGIDVEGDLTIQGSGKDGSSLTIQISETNPTSVNGFVDIYAYKSLTIKDTTLTCKTNSDHTNPVNKNVTGIQATGGLTVTDSALTAKSGETGDNKKSLGISLASSTATLTGTSEVIAIAGEVADNGDSFGITSYGSIPNTNTQFKIGEGCSLTLSGYKKATDSTPIVADNGNKFTVKGSTTANDKNPSADITFTSNQIAANAVESYKTIVVTPNAGSSAPVYMDGFGNKVNNPATWKKDQTKHSTKGYIFAGWFDDKGTELTDTKNAQDDTTYTAKWKNNGKYVRTTPLVLSSGDSTTKQSNADEGWSWELDESYYIFVLILDGCTIDVANGNGISSDSGIKVTLNGKNTINADNGSAIKLTGNWIDLQIADGTGSLNATGKDYGIDASGNTLRIDSGYVKLFGEESAFRSNTTAVGTTGQSAEYMKAGESEAGASEVSDVSGLKNQKYVEIKYANSSVPVDVKITAPASTEVKQGDSLTLAANVSDVTWSVSGGSSTDTKIDANGNLTVGADETAATITVTATATDGSTDTLTLTVVQSGTSGGGGTSGGSTQQKYATAKLKLTGYTVGAKMSDATITATTQDGFKQVRLAGFKTTLTAESSTYGTFEAGKEYYVSLEMPRSDGYTLQMEGGKAVETGNIPMGISLDGATVQALPENTDYVYFKMNAAPADDAPTPGGGGTSGGGGSSSGGSSGGGGSHSSNSSNSISVPDAKNGTVSVTPKSASKGADVTITVTPDKGYTLETLTVTDKDGKEIELTNQGNGKYTFKMPASKVDVKATFMEDNSMLNHFVDVSASAYYYDAVLWAAENGITSGIDATHFFPDGICTRAQAVTFFWRFMGSPAPKTTNMPFTDVSPDSYYYDALLWAVENGIAKGTSPTTFSPDLNCSRAHIMSFLWRSQNSPQMGTTNPFIDVKASAYYINAVLWAVQEDVTSGTSAVTFSPDADCTRAQIVTFLYRTYQGK